MTIKYVWNGFAQNATGDVLGGATVTVRDQDTNALSTLYTDKDGGTESDNPFLVGDSGQIAFYASSGRYKITAVKDSDTVTFENVVIGVPDDALQTVDTLAELPGLSSVGRVIHTNGGRTIGDGGNGSWLCSATNVALPVDAVLLIPSTSVYTSGGSVFVPSGSGYNKFDNISLSKNINQYGAVPGEDAVAAIDALIASEPKGRIVANKGGEYPLSRTVLMPIGWVLGGDSGRHYGINSDDDAVVWTSMVGGSYYKSDGTLDVSASNNKGFLFFHNIDPASPESWIQIFPHSHVHHGYFAASGEPTSGINVIYGAAETEHKSVICIKDVGTYFKKPSLYTDGIKFEHIYAQERANNTEYLIDLPGLGDAYTLNHIASGYTEINFTDASHMTKGVRIGACRSGKFTNFINGIHELNGVQAGTFSNAHIEGGYLDVYDSDIAIVDNLFFRDKLVAESPINIYGTNTAFNNNYTVRIDKNEFCSNATIREGFPSTNKVDVAIHSASIEVEIGKGNRRTITNASSVETRTVMGIQVGSDTSVDIANWKNYAAMLSTDGAAIRNRYIPITGKTIDFRSSWVGLDSIGAIDFSGAGTGVLTWKLPTDTYYYNAQLILDPVRLLGRNATSGELSVSLTSGGSIPQVILSHGSINTKGGFTVRLYRGVSTGSYDSYVDIPAIDLRKIWDNGESVNGFVWEPRTTGAMDTLNNAAHLGAAEYTDGRIKMYSALTTPPTTGAWIGGDEIVNPLPALDGNSMFIRGLTRATSGSAHAVGTDWFRQYISHVSPAV